MGMPIDGLTGVGTYEEIKSTGTGALLVASAAGGGAAQSPSNATSSAYETSRVIKASAGTLYGFTVHNSLASTQFIQLHDASSLPADAAVPVVVISAPANTTVSWSADPSDAASPPG